LDIDIINYALVFVGGGAGACCRYGLTQYVAARRQGGFPFATFSINVSGCFVLGLLAAILTSVHDAGRREALQAVFATGFLGGYTTFSTYALDTVLAARNKAFMVAALYWLGSVVLGLLAAGAGGGLARVFRL